MLPRPADETGRELPLTSREVRSSRSRSAEVDEPVPPLLAPCAVELWEDDDPLAAVGASVEYVEGSARYPVPLFMLLLLFAVPLPDALRAFTPPPAPPRELLAPLALDVPRPPVPEEPRALPAPPVVLRWPVPVFRWLDRSSFRPPLRVAMMRSPSKPIYRDRAPTPG